MFNRQLMLVVLSFCGIVIIFSYGHWQYRKGFEASETANQLKIAKLNDVAREKEQALIAQQAERDKKQYKEFKDAQDTITQLRADVAAGERRLSVKTKAPVCASPSTTTTRMDNGTSRAELDGETASDIIGLMAVGDQAIRQLNALQDWAEVVTDIKK